MALRDRIQSGDKPRPPRTLLYGVAGIGKTTFGTQAEAPIFVPTEEGSNFLRVPHFPVARTFDEFMGNLHQLLAEPHEYGTVVVDTLDWLQRLIWAKVCETNGKVANIEDIGYAKGYKFATTHWQNFLNLLDHLRYQRGMQVLFLAHADIVRFNDPSSDGWDRYQPRLHKEAAAMVVEWCDCVLFARYRVMTRTVDAGFNKKLAKPIGEHERELHTVETPVAIAKNRWSLPPVLPFTEADGYAGFARCRDAYFAGGSVSLTQPTPPDAAERYVSPIAPVSPTGDPVLDSMPPIEPALA